MSEEQEALAAAYLGNEKWTLASDDYFSPGEDFRIVKRKLADVPWENLDAALQYLAGQTSFTNLVIEGKSYEGTWFQGHVWWEKNQRKADDTNITLYQLLVCGAGGSWVFTTPNKHGPIVTTVCRDLTKATADDLLANLLNTNNNSSGWSCDRETNRWSGSITTRQESGASVVIWWDRQGVIEYIRHEHIDKDGYGVRWLYIDKVTSNFRAGSGIQFGLAAYQGGLIQGNSASSWMKQNEDNGTWSFKRVVKVERKVYQIGDVSGGTGLYTVSEPMQVPPDTDWVQIWPTDDITVKVPWGDS